MRNPSISWCTLFPLAHIRCCRTSWKDSDWTFVLILTHRYWILARQKEYYHRISSASRYRYCCELSHYPLWKTYTQWGYCWRPSLLGHVCYLCPHSQYCSRYYSCSRISLSRTSLICLYIGLSHALYRWIREFKCCSPFTLHYHHLDSYCRYTFLLFPNQ